VLQIVASFRTEDERALKENPIFVICPLNSVMMKKGLTKDGVFMIQMSQLELWELNLLPYKTESCPLRHTDLITLKETKIQFQASFSSRDTNRRQ